MLDDKTAAELSQVLQDELTRLEAVVVETRPRGARVAVRGER